MSKRSFIGENDDKNIFVKQKIAEEKVVAQNVVGSKAVMQKIAEEKVGKQASVTNNNEGDTRVTDNSGRNKRDTDNNNEHHKRDTDNNEHHTRVTDNSEHHKRDTDNNNERHKRDTENNSEHNTRDTDNNEHDGSSEVTIANNKNYSKSTTKQRVILSLSGIVTGFANGFFGGGGGMITVPVFSKLLKYEEKKAHATALLVILPISIFSSISYVFKGSLDWGITGLVAIGVLVGGIVGAVFLKKISNKALSYVFAVIMIVVGARMIF